MKTLVPVLCMLFIFSSCDPGYSVMISNQSSSDKNISVIVTKKGKLSFLDSIAIADPIAEQKRHMVRVSIDTVANSYSFTLEKGKSTILQQGIGGPDLSEKIIINGSDTIALASDKRVLRKKNGLSTAITIPLD